MLASFIMEYAITYIHTYIYIYIYIFKFIVDLFLLYHAFPRSTIRQEYASLILSKHHGLMDLILWLKTIMPCLDMLLVFITLMSCELLDFHSCYVFLPCVEVTLRRGTWMGILFYVMI